MSDPQRLKIQRSRKAAIVGTLAGWLMRIWNATLRLEFEDRSGIFEPEQIGKPVIYALWHSRIFTVPAVWAKVSRGRRPAVGLTSASKDGAILENALGVFGIGAVRGSSSRRAVAALIGMKRALQEGCDVCFTPDGPRGPRYEMHPGVVKLAQATGAPIMPMHATFDNAWRLRTWDRLVVPKPFSRVRVVFDATLAVPAKLDEAGFQAECDKLQGILLAGTDDSIS